MGKLLHTVLLQGAHPDRQDSEFNEHIQRFLSRTSVSISAPEAQFDVAQRKGPEGCSGCWVKDEHPATCRWFTEPALHLHKICALNRQPESFCL